MRSFSIVIATFQRRNALSRLLNAIRLQLIEEPELSADLDILVVIDGSTDGSLELCESIKFPVRVKAVWQRNRGRSAARNAGLNHVDAEVVWFVDDDIIPLPGLLRRHREAHESAPDHVLMGPHLTQAPLRGAAPNQAWVDVIYEEMLLSGLVDRADRFSTANASGSTSLFRRVGGFDEGFTDWGGEDVELAQRILRAGYIIRFDPEARAAHCPELSTAQFCANNVSAGRALARIVRLHPELLETLLPAAPIVPSRRAARAFAGVCYRRFPIRSPVSYRVLASVACRVAAVEAALTRHRSARALYIAMVASTLAGLAEGDPSGSLVERKLGVAESR
jgi:GT2 family glycosyltransferase